MPIDIRFHIEQRAETPGGLFQIIKTATEMAFCALRAGYRSEKIRVSPEQLIKSLEDNIAVILGVPVRVELTTEEELLKLGPPHKIPRVTKQ